MLEKSVLTTLELNWNQRLGHKKTKLNICHHMLTSFTQLQNKSFHVVERTRTSSKYEKMKNARAKRAKILHCQICKFVEFLLRCRRPNFIFLKGFFDPLLQRIYEVLSRGCGQQQQHGGSAYFTRGSSFLVFVSNLTKQRSKHSWGPESPSSS